ncbi:FecR domain-containing protein [uncultured Brevundimonas sp.]|uniref:FecR family protein n=1 Tax=uncultured Brevundimonas sp. TaxID=213418 RepID=UPI0025F83BBD|nr:FecR domain-containing protein [uncultured Brevundimonas sp.]
MSAQDRRRTAADDQADGWIARLGTRSISLDTLQEFATWREDPANAAAYRRAEQLWAQSGDLAGDSDIQAALETAKQRGPRRFGSKQFVALGLATTAAASLVVGVLFWQGRGAYATEVGEQRIIQLTDGSRVRLDTATRLKVRYTDGERRIELAEGQAFFEVAPNPDRPFIVETRDTSVTAIGTVFEVRRIGPQTRVVLVSGAVDVAPSAARAEPQRLRPNQQTAIDGRDVQLTPVNAQVATSWTNGELTFVDTPLSEAVAEVNRYLPTPIILDAPAAAATPINGVFRSGDRAAFVSAAAHLLDLQAVPGPDGQVRLTEPGKN